VITGSMRVHLAPYSLIVAGHAVNQPDHLVIPRPGVESESGGGLPDDRTEGGQACDCPCGCIADVVRWRNGVEQEVEAMARCRRDQLHNVAAGRVKGEDQVVFAA
jgi:hypothetical protein